MRLTRCSLVAAAVMAIACRGETPPPIEVGRPAPEYVATTIDGTPISLEAQRGKVVLLNIWATWCAPCREEIPALQDLHTQHASKGFEILGVSIDAPGEDEKVRAFASSYGVTYPIWRDPEDRVSSTFLAIGVPASYLIDRRGIVRWKHVGIVRPTHPTFAAVLDSALRATPGE
jgi:cytochrome c-type biogenesis protein